MPNFQITIDINGTELPATVEYTYHPACRGSLTEPAWPSYITIERVYIVTIVNDKSYETDLINLTFNSRVDAALRNMARADWEKSQPDWEGD